VAVKTTLTVAEQREVWSAMLAREPALGGTFKKGDLDAAVAAAVDFMVKMDAGRDAALPKAFRDGATDQQKAPLWAFVTMWRAGLEA
jgi:hypothetical protein